MGVTENIYTTLSLADLAKLRSSLDSSIETRNAAYKKELERQRANDALCKRFAQLAEPLVKWIIDQKDSITKSNDELEQQLKYLNDRIANAASEG